MQSIVWDGQKITKPGMYSKMPLADYHRGDICDGPSVSSSGLRDIWNKSPKHFWDKSPLNPNRFVDDDADETKALILGRATHHLMVEQAGFAAEFIQRPDVAPDGRAWNGNNKTCIEWFAQQRRDGKTVLTPEMVTAIRGMAVSLGQHPMMQQGILNGLIERSLFWRDPETGVWIKSRPDNIPSNSGDYSDLKTARSVLYRDTQRAIFDRGYHQQGALVLEGAAALGFEVNSFSLIWIETTSPHCARVQTLRDEDLERGGKMNRVALRTFHQCFTDKHWPGPGDDYADAEYIDLSDYARKSIDDRLNFQLREAA